MDATLSADSAAGQRLGRLLEGRYRIERLVARGGMATVYEGTDTRLDRSVAIKVMHPVLADDPDFLARFSREARAAARLSSPDVVAVHDTGAEEGLVYLVMEYVPGRTLRDLLRERGRLEPGEAAAILERVLSALDAAHRAGLVHRDIKPENVLLADDGRVKVADFGLARAVEAGTLTSTGLLIGTVAYLAPEQVARGVSDTRTDVYAAGVLLWELLTGEPPYAGDTPLSVAYRHVHEDVPSPSTRVPVPRALDALTVRATRRDPDVRPQDAGEFLAALRAARQDPAVGTDTDATQVVRRPVTGASPTLVVQRPAQLLPAVGAAPTPPGSRTRGARAAPARPRRRRLVVLTAALALLVGLIGTGGWYLGSGRWTSAPTVLDLDRTAAEKALTGKGLRIAYAPQAYSDTVRAGRVLKQDPRPGGRVRKGGTVRLTLSRGAQLFTIPALGGIPLDEARSRLAAANLTAGSVTEEYRDDSKAGLVFRSNPLPGEQLRRGATVDLVVSRGPTPVDVPVVIGKPLQDALAALTAVGLTGQATEAFDEDVPKGTVVSQTPADGQLPKGSRVQLGVSKGPQLYAVPAVTGQSKKTAEKAVKEAGLKPRVIQIPGPGTVRSQDPRAGTMVRKGATVTLYVF